MEEATRSDYYKTSDLNLATTLNVLGYNIERLERNGQTGRMRFCFKQDGKIDKIVEKYFMGLIRVDPVFFSNTTKNLKTRIYNSES